MSLESKSKKLKELVAQFDTVAFLGEISSLIDFIASKKPLKSLEGLSSPLRQLYYLAGLNVSSSIIPGIGARTQFTDQEWSMMKNLLNEIELGYENFFYPKESGEADDEWKLKRAVAMPTFLGYFNQGPLNYEEQVLERISEYFTPFDSEIKTHFGLAVNDFIEIYNYIDTFPQSRLDDILNPGEGKVTWKQFVTEMISKRILPPEWDQHMPQSLKESLEIIQDKGRLRRFKRQTIVDVFGEDRATAFLKALVCERRETTFLYYTEQNILHSRPIFKIDEHEYQSIELKQIIHAIYNLLVEFCVGGELKDKYFAVRGVKLEDKVERVVQKFYNNTAKVYRSFYTNEGHEQDLLFLINGTALIVEVKASKLKEPRRDPDKAYPIILSNFKEVIQKGYDQAYRVKSKFIKGDKFKLFRDQGLQHEWGEINPSKYYHVFSIIITLERFGQIQANLAELLEYWDDDEYPWSVCIDDVEVFLLTMNTMKKSKNEFVQFLHIRELLHGKLICGDELEICGAFLTKRITYSSAKVEQMLVSTPDLATVFDQHYHKGGIGFSNEKNMDLKNKPNSFVWGS